MNTTTVTHLALDPGNQESGWVLFTTDKPTHAPLTVLEFGTTENAALKGRFAALKANYNLGYLCAEMMRPRGMPTSAEEFETCVNIGRFLEAWPGADWTYIFRQDVKLAVCNSARAKDPNVRQGLIDLWGGEALALGGKKCLLCKGKLTTGRKKEPCACGTGWLYPPGPLYKMSGDAWAALAIAYFWSLAQCCVQALRSHNTPAAAPAPPTP